jgi:hypothetical protein
MVVNAPQETSLYFFIHDSMSITKVKKHTHIYIYIYIIYIYIYKKIKKSEIYIKYRKYVKSVIILVPRS